MHAQTIRNAVITIGNGPRWKFGGSNIVADGTTVRPHKFNGRQPRVCMVDDLTIVQDMERVQGERTGIFDDCVSHNIMKDEQK